MLLPFCGGLKRFDRALIIDTDASGWTRFGMDVDDDIALLMALADPHTRILDVTVTYGNAPASLCLANVKRLLRSVSAQQEIPVHLGQDCYLALPRVCSTISDMSARSAASRAIVRRVMSEPPNSVTLVALGPLTNIAAAFEEEPAVAGRLKELFIVGGDLNPAATTLGRLLSQFYWLPHLDAAKRVFASPARIKLLPVSQLLPAALSLPQLLAWGKCPRRPCLATELLGAMTAIIPMQSEHFRGMYPPEKAASQPAGDSPGSRMGYGTRPEEGVIPWDGVVMAAVLLPGAFSGWKPHAVSDLRIDAWSADEAVQGQHVLVPAKVDVQRVHGLIEKTLCSHSWPVCPEEFHTSRGELGAREKAPVAWGNVLLMIAYRRQNALLPIGVGPWMGGAVMIGLFVAVGCLVWLGLMLSWRCASRAAG